MNTYTITLDGQSGIMRAPAVLPEAGQVLTVQKSFRTLGDRQYQVGHELKLMHRTQEAPHSRLSSLGNWVVDCGKTISIWTNIELMVAEGIVK